ncbi:MAG: phosphoenolpyruvate--protein phosphotransferase [Elusimicrobia bacterium]|nr:phosphoenolpyruvate--protein phosphotransferase [Elusimicrobiota bacterium]
MVRKKSLGFTVLKGIGASKGIGIGRIFILETSDLRINRKAVPDKPEAELLRYRSARDRVSVRFNQAAAHILKELGSGKGNILDVHALILKDQGLNQEIEFLIRGGKKAEVAVETVFRGISERQKLAENKYLKERFTVSRDIGRQLVMELLGAHRLEVVKGKGDVILVARELTPFALADHPANIKGFAVETGGPTGHAAILARAYNIPMVLGIAGIESAVENGARALLNGATGELIINPSPEIVADSLRLRGLEIDGEAKAGAEKAVSETKDGRRIELLMNIANTHGLNTANTCGADGVGLFRTEFLFLNKETLPTEEEQFLEFEKVAKALFPRKVIIRTADFGGDKQPPAAAETGGTPAYPGLRGIRYCLAHPALFETHLRAILRAGTAGNVGIMFPMVPGLETFREAKVFLKRTREKMAWEGVKLGRAMRVGIMIEVPSAALMAGVLARESDFFSIGTNDLFQYTLGIDREDNSYSAYERFLPPSIVQLVQLVVESAHKKKKPAAVCGELAHQLWALPLLIGLGVDELSMDAAHIPAVRQAVRALSYAWCRELAQKALLLETPAAIRDLLKGAAGE